MPAAFDRGKVLMRMKTEKAGRVFFRAGLLIFLLVIWTGLSAGNVYAAKEGWRVKKNKIYYYLYVTPSVQPSSSETSSGEIPSLEEPESETEPEKVLAKATGLTVIGDKTYFFNSKGVLQTGLIRQDGWVRYFVPEGDVGEIGAAASGLTKVGEEYYYFHKKTGNALTGKRTIKGTTYYFAKTGSSRGRAACNKWVKLSGKYYFFGKTGAMIKNCWISKTYYVGANGARVTGWLTIGSRKYFMNSKGKKQTGLVKTGGKLYYFDENGVLLTDTKKDGYVIDSDGVAVRMPRVLLIAGHGQGDVGAGSKWGYEYKFTRQFARLIYNQLVKGQKVDVTFYKDGSTSYDCYQQNRKVLGVSGANIASQITGRGTIRSRLLAALRGKADIPDYTEYDYILEVHFNATAVSGKDENGNGSFKGCGFYINSYKSNYALEKDILARFVRLGFKQWGAGVFGSSTLFNPRICQELGVNYGLLETAFIDDGDDMKFYNKKKSKMAAAVARALEEGLAQG